MTDIRRGENFFAPMKMVRDLKKYKRRSIRLQGYDYSSDGAYFVTICAYNREYLFGEIVNGVMELNAYGKIVAEEWLKTEKIRNEIGLGEWVIMPNHFHGMITINRRGTLQRAPTCEQFGKPTSDSIPTIVRLFKSSVTTRIKKLYGHVATCPNKIWQRNYHEHVIRNENDYFAITQYILDNPMKWEMDEYHPKK